MKKKKVDITIHAGHNAPHKAGAGAAGFHDESEETRKILKEVKRLLKKEKISFADITVNHGKNAKDVLTKNRANMRQKLTYLYI